MEEREPGDEVILDRDMLSSGLVAPSLPLLSLVCVCVCMCVCMQEAREKSTGSGWYEMQAPEMTAELKNDLKLLRMRGALDPSQHYKASDWKKLPRYFEVSELSTVEPL